MHVMVLGAGVIGITTAYYLSERGHSVTVVERADGVASGASGGNGGQLSYSFTDAMASPALLSKLPWLVSGQDSAFRVRPPISDLPVCWGWAFLQQCTAQRSRENTLAVMEMALRSSALITELQANVPLEFSFRQAGKLVLLGDYTEVQSAKKMCAVKREYGSDVRVVTLDEAKEIEPALTHMQTSAAGAVYSQSDSVGDANSFTSQLGQWLVDQRGVDIRFNTDVRRINTSGGRFHAVETDTESLKADAVVVCMGAWSENILKPLHIQANIYPMRGYSLTLPPGRAANKVSISDLENKMVYSRIGEQIRIAGFADFVGFNTERDNDRTRKLLDTARRFAPAIANFDASDINEWGGFRPMTPNSQPLVGATRVKGVYLNIGHGMLGWTLACAAGHDLAASLPAA
jgi:D-amino-acid dehydrogenase